MDWGDGRVETIVAAGDLVFSPDFSATQHSYAAGGIYTITVTVTDDAGGFVTEHTAVIRMMCSSAETARINCMEASG